MQISAFRILTLFSFTLSVPTTWWRVMKMTSLHLVFINSAYLTTLRYLHLSWYYYLFNVFKFALSSKDPEG